MENAPSSPETLVGRFHRFGAAGVAYEVLEEVDDQQVKIRVVETGETLTYSRAYLASDPIA